MPQVMSAKQAVQTMIKPGNTVAFGGFLGAAHPEEVTRTIKEEFLETGRPNDLTVIFAAAQGDSGEKGLNHLGEEGLIKKIVGGHFGLVPRIQTLITENKISAYNLPQGVISHLYRDIAAGKPGVISDVGISTFVDPRVEGGKLNQRAEAEGDIVEVIELKGKEMLFYPSIPIDVSVIRASYADTNGNCTFQREGTIADAISMAQAAKNSGGKVIVQVEKLVDYPSLDPRLIKLPGIYVDAIVVASPENHRQTFTTAYNPAYCGEIRVPVKSLEPLPLDERKIVARRAAMELIPNAVMNLGIGMPEGVAVVAAEEGLEGLVLTTEAGTNGGIPAGGLDFGVAVNPDCILEQSSQFDFYDGGGLDITFLGLAQMDAAGNINVSRFGPKIAGCGGFINISQNTGKIVFCGTFTARGLKIDVQDGKLVILQEGTVKKLLREVEQITFSGNYALEHGQKVLYITERAVFELTGAGVALKEVAPGIDIEKDILQHMEFKPVMRDVKLMRDCIFRQEKMHLILP